MNLERAYHIFGQRAISSLMWASKSNIWDKVTLVLGGDVWCDNCSKIAIDPKKARSKAQMRFKG